MQWNAEYWGISVSGTLAALFCKEGIHPFRETAELRRHSLERLFLNNQKFHSQYCFNVDARFSLQSKRVSGINNGLVFLQPHNKAVCQAVEEYEV